ncbi:mandelate racemase/muconate lactonizing enzyme family protein [Ramlibacter sp.]|uniref:mandelate racemase/muconate lactonizing enzyme family protein n=1 Tax=Ramlibacter sp. TaxID=1917967 RepID=UPI003D0B9550
MRRIPTIRSLSLSGYQFVLGPEHSYGNARAMGFSPRSTLIEVETDEGVTGIGEAAGAPQVVREYLKSVQPYFIGKSIYDFPQIQSYLLNRMYHSGVQNSLTGCLGGIDVALLDAIGKTLDVRVCDLIGGCSREKIPVYASSGYFSDDRDNRFEDMLGKVKKGDFLGVKIKIGRGVASDVERVAATREILGEKPLLIVDMNAAYTGDVALQSIRAMASHDIHWVEEPLPPWDYRGYTELRQRSPVPLSAGEAHYTAQEFNRLIEGRCVDILQPSIPYTGGLREAQRIAFLAQLHNLRVAPHVWGSAIGLAVACHYGAALPPWPHTDHPAFPSFLEYDVGADNPLRDRMLKTPIVLEDSHVLLPQGPGLGIEIDRDAIEKYRVC